MSYWTHISAIIDADTNIYDDDIKSVVESMLTNAPRITGSERDADIFVNVLSGYNCTVSSDCKRCQYKDTVVIKSAGVFSCGADDAFQCTNGTYQTRVAISVVGDLRDRTKAMTHKEWKAFQKYVAKKAWCGFHIRNCACRIQGW